jgi:hypothetical protein
MTVYQRVLPGTQRDAADLFARLVSDEENCQVPVPGRQSDSGTWATLG